MKKFAVRFWSDETGASAVEYALILAIVGGGITVAALALGDAVTNVMEDTGQCMEDPTTC